MNQTTARHRLQQLDLFLSETKHLWQPQPFKTERPDWCRRYPKLTESLLTLSDTELSDLNRESAATPPLLKQHIPELDQLDPLTRLASLQDRDYSSPPNRFFDGMPGRKRQQVEAFASKIGRVDNPVLEWCGGKGHLGRVLWQQNRQPVTTLEWNQQLCDAGNLEAEKAQIGQQFFTTDVLLDTLPVDITGHHGVALHACGELHRNLQRRGAKQQLPALDIVPCCYANGVSDSYQPRTEGLQLQPSRDDLRLAVTETVTAGQREVRQRDREMAWKQGYMELCYELDNSRTYRSIKPIPKSWLQQDFAGFCKQLAAREQRLLPDSDWQYYEQRGWQRHHEVMRLQLVRNSFSRAIELWMVLDLVCDLEQQGYRVRYGTFCERQMSPRNIMISARRAVTEKSAEAGSDGN